MANVEPIKLTREQKEGMLKGYTDEWLLDCFANWAVNYNPADYEKCENYELIKAEILRRMGGNK